MSKKSYQMTKKKLRTDRHMEICYQLVMLPTDLLPTDSLPVKTKDARAKCNALFDAISQFDHFNLVLLTYHTVHKSRFPLLDLLEPS